jgi:type I restriction-modification system DNA methylase subunit
MKYTTIHIQGNLLSEEILHKVENAEANGQQAIDFGLEPGTSIRNDIEYAWSKIKLYWKQFNEKSMKTQTTGQFGTTLSRKWMMQFLREIGFKLKTERSGLQADNNQSYIISHTAHNLDSLPVHIVGFTNPNDPDKNTLDTKSREETSRFSPHGVMQEYLNVTEHVYGIVTNGHSLRLIRDSGRLIKLTYLEFDLKRMLEEDKYSEFTLLYRLLHATRFPRSKSEADQSFLEVYYQDSIETGNRIRDGLSNAVKESLMALGNGFLQHEHNSALRKKIQSKQLSAKDYYRQLLRIIYRFLFLMVTEERDLVYDPNDKSEHTQKLKSLYLKYYSIARLRKLSEQRYIHESDFNDLWLGLLQTFRLFEGSGNGKKLGIEPLDGDLFGPRAIVDLEDCLISNAVLLKCIQNMNEFRDEKNNLVSINYRSLDVEELGSVYEGLLELHPVIGSIESEYPKDVHFIFHEGTERKTTGSYYTRPELVNELIKSALIPVIEERLQEHFGNKVAQAQALLKLKICDPAAGSGHMLLAAARTISWYLARVQTGEENPAPSVYRTCLREVIQHCIYAVDMNPDAVELCKLALWIEGHNSGKPLSFLDHKVRNGNSLVGVTDLSILENGIPNDAFTPVTGDDKAVCQYLKKRNSTYLKTSAFSLNYAVDTSRAYGTYVGDYSKLEHANQDTLEGVTKVKQSFEKLRNNDTWYHDWVACNLWTAAFFWTYTKENESLAPTSEDIFNYQQRPSIANVQMIGKANALSIEHKFFHWPLEFPDVFEQGGFDVMLGNPPWERIKLQQQEFFATRDIDIFNAPNATTRNRLIKSLSQNNPILFNEYEKAVHVADATAKFLRESGRCTYTAVGDINTYSIFTEMTTTLVNPNGMTGIIVPTGIATDDSNKAFFSSIVENNRLISLYDFENREKIFQDVHSMFKFCLLTISASDIGEKKAQFGFFLTRTDHLKDEMRIFSLSKDDFLRLNPNTKTCPVFRTKIDAELTTKIYNRVPILINESTNENPWGVHFKSMFHMSNDSHLFRTRQELESDGFELFGNTMKRGKETWLPLYEAKMIWHHDHRYGSYEGVDSRQSSQTPTPSIEQYQNPSFQILPWYWVDKEEVTNLISDKWLIGFRDITNISNERTAIFSVFPLNAVSNKMPIILFNSSTSFERILFLGNICSLPFDFLVRQKIGGTSMNYFYVKQFAALSKEQYDLYSSIIIFSISLELIYTSWDIKAFADDIWKESDTELKEAIRNQWEDNKVTTGGHEWAPPEWCEIDQEGCPLPPFKWDVERRAILKAELDAIYAKLYGLTTEELRYILDPQDVYGPDFPGETFRVLKEKEIKLYGEYRTRRLVLEAWERLQQSEA